MISFIKKYRVAIQNILYVLVFVVIGISSNLTIGLIAWWIYTLSVLIFTMTFKEIAWQVAWLEAYLTLAIIILDFVFLATNTLSSSGFFQFLAVGLTLMGFGIDLLRGRHLTAGGHWIIVSHLLMMPTLAFLLVPFHPVVTFVVALVIVAFISSKIEKKYRKFYRFEMVRVSGHAGH
ncbi:hypothetical protein [Weissella cibaria]|uniref:Uncharacterized protein n=1 Tax=Weissella cibaria TaxID=137591 RepID=A0A0D1LL29_9LACO|nr:hypothetical protein [Weissella cibaria]KIU19362.1 hypothetical protein QX99_02047 [Weissella cibaria]MDV8930415.1 hypothetical protein [Weissella cibaria]